MNSSISVPIERYWGIDLHKHYLVVGGVNAKQEIVLSPRRVDLDVWPKWAQAQLTPADVVVVEATTNSWDFYDVTSPLVQRVVVANAAKIALIAKNRLQSLLHRHHLVLPSGHPFTAIHRAWWDTLPVSPTERLHLKHDLATLAQLNTQVAEIDDEVQRGGLTSRQFIRYQLVRLQLGDDLTHLRYGNMPRRIASIEEVLSLKPEPRHDA